MTSEELKKMLNSSFTELKGLLEKQQKEIKELKETTPETADKIKALETRTEEIHLELVEAVKKTMVPSQSNVNTDGSNNVKSLGRQFTESEEYKTFIATKSRASAPLELKSLWMPRRKLLDFGDGVGFSQLPFAQYADVSPERVNLRDLFTVVPTQEGSIEYVRTVGFGPVATHLTAAVAPLGTTLTVESSVGFAAGQSITVGTETHVVDSITDATTIELADGVVAAMAGTERVAQRIIFPTAHSMMKPTGDFKSLTIESATMRTLATTVDAPRQVLQDQRQLEALIDNQLTFELGFSERYNIIYGDGVSPNLDGLLNDADHQIYLWSTGIPTDTKIDALRRAMTLVFLARYPADGIIIHPLDWEDIELAKGTDEHYLWISVPNGIGGGNETFFRLPVCVTEAVAAGTAIVGAFKLAATLWDREQANIRVSESHDDYFKRNMVAILGEERLAFGVSRPEAIVEVTFDSEPVEPIG